MVEQASKTATAIILTLATVLVVIAGAFAGCYALALNAINNQKEEQLRAAIPECKALIALDNAKRGLKFKESKGHTSQTYIIRMTSEIHKVVVASQCYTILGGRNINPGSVHQK